MAQDAELAIKRLVAERGPITFAEYMNCVLYGQGGYYSAGFPVSAAGDFFTSPSAHPLFGAMVAIQLCEMWLTLDSPTRFTVVEEGAGNGGLAADITEAAAGVDPEFAAALEYIALDVAPTEQQYYPVSALTEAPVGVVGCVLSNELLDALPVHRFEVREGEVFEIFVTVKDDELVETIDKPSTPQIERRVAEVLEELPDGYRGEVNLELGNWAKRQAKMLEQGWVLTVDYGFNRETLYKPERVAGSLRTYSQHTLGQDPLAMPGKQDITTHVDFTALDESMVDAGFSKVSSTTQVEFLERLGVISAIDQIEAGALPRVEKRANLASARSLIDPDGMGRFMVACHGKNVPPAELTGFSETSSGRNLEMRHVPLLNPERHIRLTGHSPGQPGSFEIESFDDLFSEQP